MEEKSALETQCGGQHYKNMVFQPVELTYILGASPCFCKLAKYTTRDKDDQQLNLEKAVHAIKLDEELSAFTKNYQVVTPEQADFFIKKFTKNKDLQDALYSMYVKDYNSAVFCTKKYAKSLGYEI